MITFKSGDRSVVLAVCFDRTSRMHRLVNIGDRTIAPNLYDTPEDAVHDLERLEKEGVISELVIIRDI